MEDYVNRMSTLWSKVKTAGFNIDDEVAGSLMLVGLPSQYKPMILAVENSSTKISFDHVKNMLLQGLVFDNEFDESKETALAVKNKFKKNKNKTKVKEKECFCCGSTTHFI